MSFNTADLSDRNPKHTQVCQVDWRSYGGHKSFHGPVRTVRCLEDNVLLRDAIAAAQPGEVLVVDGGGSTRCALFGGHMAVQARQRGVAGLIIYGAVRDIEELGEIGLGVCALGSSPARSGKTGGGDIDVAIAFGDVTWRPGDWAYADRDGVLHATQALPEAD